MIFFHLIILLGLFGLIAADFNARAWRSENDYPDVTDFPEVSLLKNRPNNAIAFTGGGSRSYLLGLGYLSALHKLDLMKNVRYLGGISGGGWVTMTYSWAQNVVSEEVFLGPVVNPEDFSMNKLNEMDKSCARSYTDKVLALEAYKDWKTGIAPTLADAYATSFGRIYMEPVGVTPNKLFSWNADTVKDILSRNPQLSEADFTTIVRDRPFPIIGWTNIGPYEGAPYTSKNNNFTRIEITPLYIGEHRVLDVNYHYTAGLKHTKRVGGLIESFAFARKGAAPTKGLLPGMQTGLLSVPEPIQIMDLATCSAVNGYAPGTFTDLLPEKYSNDLSIHFDYWSPTEYNQPTVTDNIFSDGGAYENIPLFSFLQRRVSNIILFMNDPAPLYPSTKYNPEIDPYTGEEICTTLAAYFGVFPDESKKEEVVDLFIDYYQNQVFSTSDFIPVVKGLQDAQAKGNGIIARFNLTTIENQWWGIPAGLQVSITFVYLGRLTQWEAKLPEDMKSYFIPQENPDDLTNLVTSPPFRHFPHYQISGGNLDAAPANALSDLAGWTILENEDIFKQILQ